MANSGGAVDEKEKPADGSRHALVYRFCQICRRVLKWGETFTSATIYYTNKSLVEIDKRIKNTFIN